MGVADIDLDEFLRQCEPSGDAAYNAFKTVLERLESPSTRPQTRIFLVALQDRFAVSKDESSRCFDTYHFRIHDVLLSNYQGLQERKKLTLLEIPSIFIPEDWSFTFYEGINRHPDSYFKDKLVAELGCGNGWISIAIADKWSPSKVYGLDINPRAIKVAWINLYLNALDSKGNAIYDSERKTLLDRVEFHESDLLAYCRDHGIELDRIVGCIPQILNPNPEAMSKMITENASEEFLYSLSNYCALQGFVEDQFGLGLIARAVEEGIAVIKPAGIMVFNIGGRPGQGVCKRLFERRGFHITKLWQTKVIQAADTDISALVEIEKNSHHRFEFFMGLVGNQPICARTAWAYGKSGGPISHALSVYSCQLRQPNQVKIIFDFLKKDFGDISNSLDLSFEDDAVADEKIPFLAYLATILKDNMFMLYEPPSGSTQFRKLIAGFMQRYYHIPLDIDNVVIFPSRSVVIENALRLFSPRLAIVDQHLIRHLPKKWMTSLMIEGTNSSSYNKPEEDVITVIEAPRQSDLLIELVKKLRPQVVITGMAEYEVVTSTAFEQLLETTKEVGSRLFLDISDHLELSSLPGSNGVLKYLASNVLPSHAAIFCGLVKNKVYSDLEVAFIISEEESIFSALSKTVELLSGHTALFSQYYYGCLFHELLAFQLADRHHTLQRECSKKKSTEMIGFARSAMSAFSDAELSVSKTRGTPLIHMDVDHSSLPIPLAVKGAIFESFARQNITDQETDITTGVQLFIKDCYGFEVQSTTELVYGDFTLALFNKLILCSIEEGGTMCFPAGSNGNYVSAAKFMKANVATIPTTEDNGFKLTDKILNNFLGTARRPWIYISGPTVSPTGSIYSNQEMREILSVCAKFGARVIIDTSFSGLEHVNGHSAIWNLEEILCKLNGNQNFSVCLLGGLSSGMLSGGIEFGFLVMNDPLLVELFHSFPGLSKPHSTLRYAIKKLLGMTHQNLTSLSEAIAEQKTVLKTRASRLKETLEHCGWDVLDCSGGISVMAKPSAYLGKSTKAIGLQDDSNTDITLGESNIREAILKATGLCINSSSWTGVPGYCRFTIALQESEFESALQSILRFKELVLGE